MTKITIGTRDSALALWQAKRVASQLQDQGLETELLPLKSTGDIDLKTPLHQFGSTGVFTKILDDALLEQSVDIAVHSLKDYPTQAPNGIVMAAVLERGAVNDILVHKGDTSFLEKEEALIATGSIRRIAQWKSRYPNHSNPNLRGNVQTRLGKLADGNWDGAIFAKAGLERLGLLPQHYIELDWMIPAPAQGIIGITCRAEDTKSKAILATINHETTALQAQVERDFLKQVEGGCSAPVGAHAVQVDSKLSLRAGVFSLDGSNKVILENTVPLEAASQLGINLANEALNQGAKAIMDKIKHD